MQLNNLVKIQGKQIKVLYLTTLVLFLPLIASIYFLYIQDTKDSKIIIEPEANISTPITLNSVQTTAHSALVISLNTQSVLYKKNSDKPLPLASLTKLITAKVAEDQSKNSIISIEKMRELSEYGDIKLTEGAQWDKEELIDYTLITSSNDGAHSLLRDSKDPSLFTQKMNTLASVIGLSNTYFYNETGLDDDQAGILGSKGTAQDVGKILAYILKNNLALYEKTKYATITVSTPEGLQKAVNTNDVANALTGLLISKTGYTDLAGGNLAIVADMGLNEPVAFIVLKSSKESRFNDVLKLQEEYFAQARERMR